MLVMMLLEDGASIAMVVVLLFVMVLVMENYDIVLIVSESITVDKCCELHGKSTLSKSSHSADLLDGARSFRV